MPIYEYECKACGYQYEAIQKISDAPLTQCPECRKGALNKIVSLSSFKLTGTGWYVTDFRDKGKKPEAKPVTETSKPATETKKTSADD